MKRTRPAEVRAYKPDADEPTVIKPQGERGRWERVLAALPRELERVEFCDGKGSVLWALDFDQAEEKEKSDEATSARRDERLLALLVKAQESAQAGQLEGFRATMKGLTDTLGILSTRLATMEKTFGEVLKLAYEATVAAALADVDEQQKGQEDPLAGLASSVMQSLAPPQKKGPTPPANGTPG